MHGRQHLKQTSNIEYIKCIESSRLYNYIHRHFFHTSTQIHAHTALYIHAIEPKRSLESCIRSCMHHQRDSIQECRYALFAAETENQYKQASVPGRDACVQLCVCVEERDACVKLCVYVEER